jgi:catechol 2,3-dioxygenase-like lactoylglutathione lyase family enzyme
MFTKIRVISIPVKDQQLARKFYTDVLGCTVERDMPFGYDGKTRWISLQLPGV